jgi:hypothetical protein
MNRDILLDEQRRIVAYLDSVQARLASLRELQSAMREEMSALIPSVLDKAFKAELKTIKSKESKEDYYGE